MKRLFFSRCGRLACARSALPSAVNGFACNRECPHPTPKTHSVQSVHDPSIASARGTAAASSTARTAARAHNARRPPLSIIVLFAGEVVLVGGYGGYSLEVYFVSKAFGCRAWVCETKRTQKQETCALLLRPHACGRQIKVTVKIGASCCVGPSTHRRSSESVCITPVDSGLRSVLVGAAVRGGCGRRGCARARVLLAGARIVRSLPSSCLRTAVLRRCRAAALVLRLLGHARHRRRARAAAVGRQHAAGIHKAIRHPLFVTG